MKRTIILILITCLFVHNKAIAEDDIVTSVSYGTYEIDSSTTITVNDTLYHVSYHLNPDSFKIVEVNTSKGAFCYIELPEYSSYDFRDTPGLPALPIKSLNIQIPQEGLWDSLEHKNLSFTFQYIYLPHRYIPAQEYYKTDDDNTFEYESNYYDTCNSFDHFGPFIESSPVLQCMSACGMFVNFNPIEYNPSTNQVKIITSLSFDIRTPSLNSLTAEEITDGEGIYEPRGMKPQNLTFPFKRRLLILTRNKYLDNLQEYIDYKEAHNFTVDVNTAEQFSANNIPSASEIATFINSKLNSNERPQYILIVGNPVNDIPYSDGIIDKRSDPATDFEYLTEMQTQLKTCKRISGNVSIGRWPVFSENDVTTIANKTIQYELAMGKRNWNDMFATSVSGTGSNSFGRSQAKQMNMMADKLSEAGLQCERRDGRYWNTTLIDQVFKDSAHVNNTWLVIYTGHGYFTSLYNPMENFIGNTTNYVQPPILFSYACLTNACDTNTNFGRCFLSRSSSKGGIANYGSTTTTTINEDWYLSKLMLSVFSKNKSLGKNILCGMMNY